MASRVRRSRRDTALRRVTTPLCLGAAMDPTTLSAAAETTIRDLLAEANLDPSYRAFVARHLDAPDAGWRWCCGSNCDPCVQRLGHVVDRAREALAIAPPS